MLNLEIQQFASFNEMGGVDFYAHDVNRIITEEIINEYSYGIKDWGWITVKAKSSPLDHVQSNGGELSYLNHIDYAYGLSPSSIWDDIINTGSQN